MSSVFAQRRQKLLSLKALRGSSPAPAAVNRDFDQGRFQALKEG